MRQLPAGYIQHACERIELRWRLPTLPRRHLLQYFWFLVEFDLHCLRRWSVLPEQGPDLQRRLPKLPTRHILPCRLCAVHQLCCWHLLNRHGSRRCTGWYQQLHQLSCRHLFLCYSCDRRIHLHQLPRRNVPAVRASQHRAGLHKLCPRNMVPGALNLMHGLHSWNILLHLHGPVVGHMHQL